MVTADWLRQGAWCKGGALWRTEKNPGPRLTPDSFSIKIAGRASAGLVSSVYSSLSMPRSCSRSSGVSGWPWTSAACWAATGITSSSLPEIFSVQLLSRGNSLQSMYLRRVAAVVVASILGLRSFVGIRGRIISPIVKHCSRLPRTRFWHGVMSNFLYLALCNKLRRSAGDFLARPPNTPPQCLGTERRLPFARLWANQVHRHSGLSFPAAARPQPARAAADDGALGLKIAPRRRRLRPSRDEGKSRTVPAGLRDLRNRITITE